MAYAIEAFVDRGSSEGAVNFPNINMPSRDGTHRVLNVHRNVPGVLSAVNGIVSELGAYRGVEPRDDAQRRLPGDDVDQQLSDAVHERIAALPFSVRTRILYWARRGSARPRRLGLPTPP